MIKVKRGNVTLRIDEVKLKDYQEMGYRHFDGATGKFLDEEPVTSKAGIEKLRKQLESANSKIGKLTKENEDLKKQLASKPAKVEEVKQDKPKQEK